MPLKSRATSGQSPPRPVSFCPRALNALPEHGPGWMVNQSTQQNTTCRSWCGLVTPKRQPAQAWPGGLRCNKNLFQSAPRPGQQLVQCIGNGLPLLRRGRQIFGVALGLRHQGLVDLEVNGAFSGRPDTEPHGCNHGLKSYPFVTGAWSGNFSPL